MSGNIFDTLVVPSIADLDQPAAPRRSILDVMCDQSIPLFGRYEGGVCVEKGRAEIRDEHFAALPGYRRGTPYRAGMLAPWSRTGDRRFCDIDGTGRIYAYELREEQFLARTLPDGMEIWERGWVAVVSDYGLNGREHPVVVATVKRRVVGTDGEVAELPFVSGNECVTAFYRYMRDFTALEAATWLASEAGQAHLAKMAAHQAAQAEARKAALRAPVEKLQRELEEIKAAGLASEDEGEREALRELFLRTHKQYQEAAREYNRAIAF